MTELPVGTRIRLNGRCPWLHRVGCVGSVVAPPTGGTYPQPAKGEVLVLLDNDPLENPHWRRTGWSCVINAASVDVLTP